MENKDILEKRMLRKIPTHISGLDKLLYDGVEMSADPTVIAIQGDDITDRSLLGFQMLYGMGQSIVKITKNLEKYNLFYFSSLQETEYLNDMFLDTVIATSIGQLTQNYLSGKLGQLLSNQFASTFFDLSKVLCRAYDKNIYEKLPLLDIASKADFLLCKEIMYYNSRTNSLHFNDVKNKKTNEKNILFNRKKGLFHDFFTGDNIKQKMYAFRELLGLPLIDARIESIRCCDDFKKELLEKNVDAKALVALEISNNQLDEQSKEVYTLIENLKQNKHVQLIVLICSDTISLPENMADIYIKMKEKINDGYLLKFLSITRNRRQQSAMGWHQYKRRDTGIEVYPSLHTLLSTRRYLQRALVYTHSDVINDTYQQFLNNCRTSDYGSIYEMYIKNSHKKAEDYVQALFNRQKISYNSIDILERILLSDGGRRFESFEDRELSLKKLYNYRGGVTAIIGEANTYKRFLVFGSLFSSSLYQEHTLILLMNKDDEITKRKLICPAMAKRGGKCEECPKCYTYIHFMNICMGMITPSEFLYYLEKQIKVTFSDGKQIKRIVIDDLQMMEYCFPWLANDGLFLSALVSLCNEYQISVYMMCDKNCSSVGPIRALAENVICTGRDNNGDLMLYIERYAGYQNTPSKIYCGRIKNTRDLFQCYKKRNDNDMDVSLYSLNSLQIEDKEVASMDSYWKS